MKNYNVNNLIYFVNSSFKNKSYNLTLKLLEELIKRDKTFYKAYCLLGYIIFIKSENNKKKLKQAIKYFDISISFRNIIHYHIIIKLSQKRN